MFVSSLSRPPQRRLLVCLLLFGALLVAGAGVLPAEAQQQPPAERHYTWVGTGVGAGQTGLGWSLTGGSVLKEPVFAGGRFVYTEKHFLQQRYKTNWGGGPLLGIVVSEGRWGHLSVATGGMLVVGRRFRRTVVSGPFTEHAEIKYERYHAVRIGAPLDVQAFFTPFRTFGVGLHVYATLNSDENLFGVSLQVQFRQ